jgi:hypothetical protein
MNTEGVTEVYFGNYKIIQDINVGTVLSLGLDLKGLLLKVYNTNITRHFACIVDLDSSNVKKSLSLPLIGISLIINGNNITISSDDETLKKSYQIMRDEYIYTITGTGTKLISDELYLSYKLSRNKTILSTANAHANTDENAIFVGLPKNSIIQQDLKTEICIGTYRIDHITDSTEINLGLGLIVNIINKIEAWYCGEKFQDATDISYTGPLPSSLVKNKKIKKIIALIFKIHNQEIIITTEDNISEKPPIMINFNNCVFTIIGIESKRSYIKYMITKRHL